ncbi:MAG TPA: response regulator transcription factor [Bryobacteraceae bacterium]|nr:response regulator transcription factor [Bryobacteraceae bacterium]
MRILLVEDEARLADLIGRGLRERSYAVDIVGDGEQALYMASINDYDVILLDVMLPRKDGYAVCRELRQLGSRVPVLMLTARGGVDDRVFGLDAGADDYLVKPFEFKELLARIRALQRRAVDWRPPVARIADLTIDTASHAVLRNGRNIRLTAKEYALIEYLVLKQGCVVSRADIAHHVWDENFDPFSNIIDVYINRLRIKIDAGSGQPLIHTRRGEGYILMAIPEAASERA